jgi:hypothetical protein
VASIVKIAGAYAFNSGQLDRLGEQAGSLHTDADDSKAQAITGRNRAGGCKKWFGFKQDRVRSQRDTRGSGTESKEFAA